MTGNTCSISWNLDGSLLAAISRDKVLHIVDPRAQTGQQTPGLQGTKP